MLIPKDLAAQYDAQTVNILEVLLLKDLEGPSGERAWGRVARQNRANFLEIL